MAKPREGESLRSYRRRQTSAAQRFIDFLVSCGFGPIAHVEQVRHGAAGAASYLSKYLSKEKRRILRRDGRSARVAEGSRNWLPASAAAVKTYAYGASYATEEESYACPIKDGLHDGHKLHKLRKSNIQRAREYWLGLLPDPPLLVEFRRVRSAYRRAFSARQTTLVALEEGRRPPRSEESTEIEVERCKAANQAIVDEIRYDGYLGPIYLLDELVKDGVIG